MIESATSRLFFLACRLLPLQAIPVPLKPYASMLERNAIHVLLQFYRANQLRYTHLSAERTLEMPTLFSDSLRHLHAWPVQTRCLQHHRVSGTDPCSCRCIVRCRSSVQSRNTAQLLGLASAACLFMTSPMAHADEDITRSFNKNCIGASALALHQASFAS